MAEFEELAAGLRAWAEGDRIATAAVELLIFEAGWLRRPDFIAACTDSGEGMTRPDWEAVRKFANRKSLRASDHEITMLRLAAAIGSDEYRLAGKGRANAAAIMRALATALRAEGMIRG